MRLETTVGGDRQTKGQTPKLSYVGFKRCWTRRRGRPSPDPASSVRGLEKQESLENQAVLTETTGILDSQLQIFRPIATPKTPWSSQVSHAASKHIMAGTPSSVWIKPLGPIAYRVEVLIKEKLSPRKAGIDTSGGPRRISSPGDRQ